MKQFKNSKDAEQCYRQDNKKDNIVKNITNKVYVYDEKAAI